MSKTAIADMPLKSLISRQTVIDRKEAKARADDETERLERKQIKDAITAHHIEIDIRSEASRPSTIEAALGRANELPAKLRERVDDTRKASADYHRRLQREHVGFARAAFADLAAALSDLDKLMTKAGGATEQFADADERIQALRGVKPAERQVVSESFLREVGFPAPTSSQHARAMLIQHLITQAAARSESIVLTASIEILRRTGVTR